MFVDCCRNGCVRIEPVSLELPEVQEDGLLDDELCRGGQEVVQLGGHDGRDKRGRDVGLDGGHFIPDDLLGEFISIVLRAPSKSQFCRGVYFFAGQPCVACSRRKGKTKVISRRHIPAEMGQNEEIGAWVKLEIVMKGSVIYFRLFFTV